MFRRSHQIPVRTEKGGPRRPGRRAMKEEIYRDLIRYEEMADLCSGGNPNVPDQCRRDRIRYGAEYLPRPDHRDMPMYSPAKIVRFLVEVCGHSYNDAVDAVVEDMRTVPSSLRRPLPRPDAEARMICGETHNIIEALFDLKVVRIARQGDEYAVGYARDVTRALMTLERPAAGGDE